MRNDQLIGARPVYSTTRRDLELSALASIVKTMGFRAIQAHALGAVDDKTLDAMPAPQRQFLHEQAEQFVMAVNDYRRDRARRLATIHARKWMTSHALAIESLFCDQPTAVRNAVNKAFERLIDDMTSAVPQTNLIRETLAAYAEGLTRPLPQDERAPRDSSR